MSNSGGSFLKMIKYTAVHSAYNAVSQSMRYYIFKCAFDSYSFRVKRSSHGQTITSVRIVTNIYLANVRMTTHMELYAKLALANGTSADSIKVVLSKSS